MILGSRIYFPIRTGLVHLSIASLINVSQGRFEPIVEKELVVWPTCLGWVKGKYTTWLFDHKRKSKYKSRILKYKTRSKNMRGCVKLFAFLRFKWQREINRRFICVQAQSFKKHSLFLSITFTGVVCNNDEIIILSILTANWIFNSSTYLRYLL